MITSGVDSDPAWERQNLVGFFAECPSVGDPLEDWINARFYARYIIRARSDPRYTGVTSRIDHIPIQVAVPASLLTAVGMEQFAADCREYDLTPLEQPVMARVGWMLTWQHPRPHVCYGGGYPTRKSAVNALVAARGRFPVSFDVD